jgi:flagellar FliL protein
MAAEEDKTTVEVTETPEAAATKKGGNKLILFGGIGLGAVIIGVVLTIFVVRPMMQPSADSGEATQAEQADSHGGEEEATGGHGEEEKSESHGGDQKKGEAIVYAIDDIVVNPANTGGSRFLSVSIGFELGSAKLASQFEGRELVVRDALITILSSKTVAQLTDAREKEVIRFQIMKRVSDLLGTDQVKGVYYKDFVLQ